ncbi:MAG: HAD family hydrolase [Anaerolineales bacterium]|nr:HAD family hydrolase [Anaerolineales bacterium]
MSPGKTRWIVFDAMGVIFDEADDVSNRLVPFLRRRGCSADGETVHAAYRQASLGRIAPRELRNGFGLGREYPAVEREYLDNCLQLDPHLLETAEALAGKYSLAILSNDVAEWSAYLRKRHGLEKLFRITVTSGEAGFRKPDPAIYRILLERLRADGKDCLFIDDRRENLPPAAALGIFSVWLAKEGSGDQDAAYPRIGSLAELPGLADEYFSNSPSSSPGNPPFSKGYHRVL